MFSDQRWVQRRALLSSFLIFEVEEAGIQIQDPELRKMLSLTTADLRFADYMVKHVTENRDDVFLDGTGWEGGDEWIRAQFALYLHSLLSSALQRGGRGRSFTVRSGPSAHFLTGFLRFVSAQITRGCWRITAPRSSPPGRTHTTTGCGSATSTPP